MTVYEAPDYTEYLTSIEERLESIQNDMRDFKNDIHSDIESIKGDSYFGAENLQTFVPYANNTDVANILIGQIIMLGCIFGALIFRHFRK